MLIGLGRLATERDDVASVDINPLIVGTDGVVARRRRARRTVALAGGRVGREFPEALAGRRPTPSSGPCSNHEGVLVDRGIEPPGQVRIRVAAQPAREPGCTAGGVYGTNLKGEEVLGIRHGSPLDDLPDGEADLVFVCTPAAPNPDLLRACAAQGHPGGVPHLGRVRRGGRRRAGGRAELVALADELGILLAGRMARAWSARRPPVRADRGAVPAGRAIAVASQSGNFVSSFLNCAATGVGIAVRCRPATPPPSRWPTTSTGSPTDDATSVGLAYVEGITDGRGLMDRLAGAAAVKAARAREGWRHRRWREAAASHTGALAADDKVFDGECRPPGSPGRRRDRAFEAAATFATQPCPPGPNTVVLTTAGGWGVVTADAITRDPDLVLMELPDDLRDAIDGKLPPRWSRNNPSTAPVARPATRSRR